MYPKLWLFFFTVIIVSSFFNACKASTISWKIIAKAKSYTKLTKWRNLCNTKKFYILCKPHTATLNKHNDTLIKEAYLWKKSISPSTCEGGGGGGERGGRPTKKGVN